MTEKPALASSPWNEAYRIHGLEAVLTPGLAIYEEAVEANIAATLRALGGDANRWRPHVKTAKLEAVMRRLGECGVANFKCATTLELLVAAQSGAADVLVAPACWRQCATGARDCDPISAGTYFRAHRGREATATMARD